MNSLRDAGTDLIGAAELVYAEASSNGVNLTPETMSAFIAKAQKLLLLLAHNENEKESFETMAEAIRNAAESTNTEDYRVSLDEFSKSINALVLQE